ncbi:hypothetical protein ACA910_000379 [Epithemia clementina (nom. ined.)]
MSPPLPPSQLGTCLTFGSRTKILVECFVDLVCPYSCKLFNTLYEGVLPALKDDPDIQFVLHQVIQPWHPQGTMVHEAALAGKRVAPEKYAEYVHALYGAYSNGRFDDSVTWEKSRAQLYDECVTLLPNGVNGDAVKTLLLRTESGAGNAVTQELKWACKIHRSRGVHVTPTVFVNGLEATAVSSGWTKEEWLKFLEKKGEDFFQV